MHLCGDLEDVLVLIAKVTVAQFRFAGAGLSCSLSCAFSWACYPFVSADHAKLVSADATGKGKRTGKQACPSDESGRHSRHVIAARRPIDQAVALLTELEEVAVIRSLCNPDQASVGKEAAHVPHLPEPADSFRLRSLRARLKKAEDWVALGFPDVVYGEHGIAAAPRRHTSRIAHILHRCLDGPAQALATPAVSVAADYGAFLEFLEADNTL